MRNSARVIRLLLGLVAGVLLAAGGDSRPAQVLAADLVIRGGTIYDGSGKEPMVGNVVIRGERIVAVGRHEPEEGDRVIDCEGLAVAPGLIDLHTHSDSSLRDPKARRCLNYLLQGCTTMVTGNCGGGPVDVGKYLGDVDAKGAGCNIIHLVPHGSVRSAAMGSARREPTPEELERMKTLVERGMREGAFGMSTGLIYPPSSYGKTDEIVALAEVVAAHGGIYATHMRDEEAGLVDGVAEAIEIGRRAGAAVQVSHFKVKGIPSWGLVRQAAELVEQARSEGLTIFADQYPYTASFTSLAATTLPDDQIPGGRRDLARRMAADPELAAKVRKVVAAQLGRSERIVIATCRAHPEYEGKGVRQIAEEEKVDPVDLILRLVAEGDVKAVNHAMSDDDVRWIMQLPWVATASDGSAMAVRPGNVVHPRNFGTFARKIGRFAIAEGELPVEFAIRSASGLPADILGLDDRGYLRSGYVADVVVFDPQTFRDQATFESPQQYATGVRRVFLAGKAAVTDGKPSEELYGRALRHMPKPAM